jgi:hypothetical protein
VIDSEQAARDFVDQVEHHGVTNLDDPNGAADDSSLQRGVEAYASEASGGAPDRGMRDQCGLLEQAPWVTAMLAPVPWRLGSRTR